MIPTLANQYQRWFEYEKHSHRQVLASMQTVPVDRRGSEPFRKAVDLMGHLTAARRMWLYRLGTSTKRTSNLFPSDVAYDDLPGELEAMERDWSDYLQGLDERELERVVAYQSVEGGWFRNVVADILAQLYGHSLYHRGQIASLVPRSGRRTGRHRLHLLESRAHCSAGCVDCRLDLRHLSQAGLHATRWLARHDAKRRHGTLRVYLVGDDKRPRLSRRPVCRQCERVTRVENFCHRRAEGWRA